MRITTAADGTLATLAVEGTIDTRAAPDFEKALAAAVEGGARSLILDFAKVDLITSAGIRVLVLFGKRLGGVGGGLALCSLSADVRRVFEIAGLARQLRIFDTRAEAATALAPATAPAPKPRSSRVARLVGSLLGGRGEADSAERPREGAQSTLSKQVARLLGETPREK